MILTNYDKWDIRFIQMAQLVSTWSKDPSTKVGAVIVRPDRTVASVGFNGFPRGCSDAPELYEDREVKYSRVIHGEVNALLSCREPMKGYTMYEWPVGYGPSCDRCTVCIIQSGVSRVVYVHTSTDKLSHWRDSVERGLGMYAEAGVEVVGIPEEEYWHAI